MTIESVKTKPYVNRIDLSKSIRWFATGLIAMTIAVTGCNDNSRQVAKARGTVIMNDKPLTGGRIMFQPFAEGSEKRVGKAALGEIQSDGTFVLTTYSEGDGAVVGKHHPVVMSNKKRDENEVEEGQPLLEGPDIGTHRLDQVCEVVAGEENVFTIKFSSNRFPSPKDDD